MCNENFREPRERILMKNIATAGALIELLNIDGAIVQQLVEEKYGRKKALRESNQKALQARRRLRQGALQLPAAFPSASDGRERRQNSDRRQHRHRARLRLCRRDGGRMVSHHAVHLRDGRLQELLREVPQGPRNRREQLPDSPGRRRTRGHRHGDRRFVERRARFHLHRRTRAFR